MEFHFIKASVKYNTLEKPVAAPYLRKTFICKTSFNKIVLRVCTAGFYRLFINGKEITKGPMAPYVTNPDHIVYYDEYSVESFVQVGENVVGLMLGNGFQNNPGGYIWDFDKAPWRSAPITALHLYGYTVSDQEPILITDSKTGFMVCPSPILFDDLRKGEIYDASMEKNGWSDLGYKAVGWKKALTCLAPRGELRKFNGKNITITAKHKPVSISKGDDGYLYDFGFNSAGVCQLSINGQKGQEITLYHGEHLIDGKLDRSNLNCDRTLESQKVVYICSGNRESYTPSFTYFGFRYVLVQGLMENQANEDLLTYLEYKGDYEERGGFSCSEDTLNTLNTLVIRSTLSNFLNIPTDCPQREKNGWTADAALSVEHTLLNFGAEDNYAEWMHSVRKAQREDGSLPGIVPTHNWGFHWGNGPAWDCALVWIPWYVYRYTGNKAILEDNAAAILRYLAYINEKIGSDGLIAIGLGDWCQTGNKCDEYDAPLVFTDTVMVMDICQKSEDIFAILKQNLSEKFAQGLYQKLRRVARRSLIHYENMTALGACQTSQSMAIYYNLFDEQEKPKALEVLVQMIKEKDKGHMNVGVLGGRVIYHVLSQNGYTDLALDMILTPEFPSYTNWILRGATSLWEDFSTEEVTVNSLNHQFWGDIGGWMMQTLGGFKVHPNLKQSVIDICPVFPQRLQWAKAFHNSPTGRVSIFWQRTALNTVTLEIEFPPNTTGDIILTDGYLFENGDCKAAACNGKFLITNR
ncbi:MAG: family 78 glycoside hydrolase catalytic domain [Vallitaleaceae bacterium]|nr:family 78 glycoside hydrolase catalytic domain [Vallitaleaceae bacterium]